MTKDDLKKMFLPTIPTATQLELMDEFTQLFYSLAGTIMVNTTASADQTIALRKLQEARMFTTLAILGTESK